MLHDPEQRREGGNMPAAALDQLIERIYDAAIEPAVWTTVMQGMRRLYHTGAETLYFLDYRRDTERHLHIEGIARPFLENFSEIFFTADNPCTRAPALHRPGIVRTDEILCRHLGQADLLTRSTYFNEWMRPQGLHHSMGVTPLAEDGWVLNVTLLRGGPASRFTAHEQRGFGRLGVHLRHALRMARRLDSLSGADRLASAALDQLRHGVVLLDRAHRVLHANRIAEALLRDGSQLRQRASRLTATDPAEHDRLEAALAALARPGAPPPPPLVLRRTPTAPRLVASAMPLLPGRTAPFGAAPATLLLLADPAADRPGAAAMLHGLYGLNATERRLALALIEGESLRDAAERAGVTYETARWNLKVLFQKTDTRRQTELVARLLGDLTAALHTLPNGVARH
jgi:DNA-binding CsgD family transcriptional regulator/PAS domain-containing protein